MYLLHLWNCGKDHILPVGKHFNIVMEIHNFSLPAVILVNND